MPDSFSDEEVAAQGGYQQGLDNVIASLDTLIESARKWQEKHPDDKFTSGRIAGMNQAKGQALRMLDSSKRWS